MRNQSDAGARRPPGSVIALLLIAAALVLTPAVGTLLRPVARVDPAEGRALAPAVAPPVDAADWERFRAASARWLQDHIAGRDQTLALLADLRRWLGEPLRGLVQRGRGDWLFYDDGRFDIYRGLVRFDDAQLAFWQARARRLADAAAARGLRLLFVLGPDKFSIYPEYLPWWARSAPAPTATDRLMALAREVLGEDALDPRALLTAAKTGGQYLYFRRDSHWNDRAGRLVADAILARLRDAWPALPPVDAARLRPTVKSMQGDLMRQLREGPIEEPFLAYDQGCEVSWLERGALVPQGIRLLRGGVAEGPRVLLVGDSFTFTLLPFLCASLPALYSVYPATYADLPGLLDRYPVDVVIVLSAEVYLFRAQVFGPLE